MEAQRGKRLAMIAGVSGTIVLVVVVFLLKNVALEFWYLSRLNVEDDDIRREAAERLGAMRSQRAVQPLVDLLVHQVTSDPERFPSPQRFLFGGVGDSHWAWVQFRYASQALVRIGAAARPAVISQLATENDAVFRVVRGVLSEMEAATSREAPAVVELLRSHCRDVRLEALRALAGMRSVPQDCALAVIPQYASTDPHLAWSVLDRLAAEYGDESIAVPLTTALTRGERQERWAAAHMFTRLGDRAAIASRELTIALEDNDPFVRQLAARALRSIDAAASR